MSYMSMHNRIRRVLGSARNHNCECGAPAQEWAYNHAAEVECVDSLGRRYSRNLGDYIAMCFRCHRLFDKAEITHCLMDAGKRKCRTCVYARNRKRPLSLEQRARKIELQRQRRASA